MRKRSWRKIVYYSSPWRLCISFSLSRGEYMELQLLGMPCFMGVQHVVCRQHAACGPILCAPLHFPPRPWSATWGVSPSLQRRVRMVSVTMPPWVRKFLLCVSEQGRGKKFGRRGGVEDQLSAVLWVCGMLWTNLCVWGGQNSPFLHGKFLCCILGACKENFPPDGGVKSVIWVQKKNKKWCSVPSPALSHSHTSRRGASWYVTVAHFTPFRSWGGPCN